MSMRILHTAHSYPPDFSGVSEVVRQLSERLAQRGHEVHVATSLYGTAPREEILGGVTVHRFSVRGNTVQGIKGEHEDYVSFVRSGRWDVLGMHCAQIWSTDLLLPLLGQLHTKKVFTTHGLLTPGNTGSFLDLLHRFSARSPQLIAKLISATMLTAFSTSC
jgi:L-malate glycosyltransferase